MLQLRAGCLDASDPDHLGRLITEKASGAAWFSVTGDGVPGVVMLGTPAPQPQTKGDALDSQSLPQGDSWWVQALWPQRLHRARPPKKHRPTHSGWNMSPRTASAKRTNRRHWREVIRPAVLKRDGFQCAPRTHQAGGQAARTSAGRRRHRRRCTTPSDPRRFRAGHPRRETRRGRRAVSPARLPDPRRATLKDKSAHRLFIEYDRERSIIADCQQDQSARECRCPVTTSATLRQPLR
jgi:hypothetical protein